MLSSPFGVQFSSSAFGPSNLGIFGRISLWMRAKMGVCFFIFVETQLLLRPLTLRDASSSSSSFSLRFLKILVQTLRNFFQSDAEIGFCYDIPRNTVSDTKNVDILQTCGRSLSAMA